MKYLMNKLKGVAWWVRYVSAATGLVVMRDISWSTWRHAMKEYPSAVCGRRGAWVIDPNMT